MLAEPVNSGAEGLKKQPEHTPGPQVPLWLDVTHPRVTIVPHSRIFRNLSHLPTFSSPAIEANLHRIPGLSQQWLYFNDDVFLTQPTYPTDWLTSPAKGRMAYKIYRAWPVPNCSPVSVQRGPSNGTGIFLGEVRTRREGCASMALEALRLTDTRPPSGLPGFFRWRRVMRHQLQRSRVQI